MPIRNYKDPSEYEYISIEKLGPSQIELPPAVIEYTVYHWLFMAWVIITIWIARKLIVYGFIYLINYIFYGGIENTTDYCQNEC